MLNGRLTAAFACRRLCEVDLVFSRVAIVNRGEPAMRLIRAIGELNAEGGPRTETVALYTDADAAWVGWGFVAEDPAFAELCEKLGVTFIGPDPGAMRKLGDKIGAKLIAEEVGVPLAPWSRGPVEDLDAALRAAERIGYPLMLKAAAGGGGRGIRVITGPGELADAYERTSLEAQRAFGSGVMFLERLVTGARHVEVQVIADGQGTAWA